MRKTHATVQVAIALSQDPFGRHWGYALTKTANVRSGVLYPILRRMFDDGWLTDGWEAPEDAVGRPPRRYYELTDAGRRGLGGLLVEAGADQRFAGLPFGQAVTG